MSHGKVIEPVPARYTRRNGDTVIEGANNTIIIFGTDRARAGQPAGPDHGIGTVESPGRGVGTGAIYVIAGRKDQQGNPDIQNDESSVYVTRKTSAPGSIDGKPSVIVRSTVIRMSARQRFRIVLDGDETLVDVDASGITVTSKTATVVVKESEVQVRNSTRVTVESPNVQINGNVSVAGNLSIAGNITVPGGSDGPGSIDVSGKVSGGSVTAGGVDLEAHYHRLTGAAKAGPDIIQTLPPE